MSEIAIRLADLSNPNHQQAVVQLTNHYATTQHALGHELPLEIQQKLIEELKVHPANLIFLAWQGENPVGMANCFVVFSTFFARKMLNIHDLVVHESHRGKGLGKLLLEACEAYAVQLGFGKLSLEVSPDNPAQRLYERSGFKISSHYCTKELIPPPYRSE